MVIRAGSGEGTAKERLRGSEEAGVRESAVVDLRSKAKLRRANASRQRSTATLCPARRGVTTSIASIIAGASPESLLRLRVQTEPVPWSTPSPPSSHPPCFHVSYVMQLSPLLPLFRYAPCCSTGSHFALYRSRPFLPGHTQRHSTPLPAVKTRPRDHHFRHSWMYSRMSCARTESCRTT